MITPADVQTGLVITKFLFSGFNELMEIAKKSNDNATKKIIVELEGKLVDIEHLLITTKRDVNGLLVENEELKAEIAKLKATGEKEITKEGEFYINKNKPDELYCSMCYETDKLLISLKKMPIVAQNLGTHQCPKCRNLYVKENKKR